MSSAPASVNPRNELRKPAALGRALISAAIGLLFIGCLMTIAWSADISRTWQTDKARLLDSKEFINATSKVLNGAIPGNNKQYDVVKVSKDLMDLLLAELKDSKGVHAETALATLAGFSAQMAIRETLIKSGQLTEDKAFVIVTTKDGGTYYFGDVLNGILFENKLSIYYWATDVARQSGAMDLPDVEGTVRHVASTVGTDKFGIPRVPSEHLPKQSPIDLLDKFWNPVRNFLVISVDSPAHWPLVLGVVTQAYISLAKDILDPALAAKLVMEAAVPMSKIDPARIHFAYFQPY